MHFLSPELERYVEAHSQPEPALLARLNRETHLKVLQPRMLSGHFQGRFLSLVSKLARPAVILEIGTYTGYSALCLVEGLAPGGILHTIDIKEELQDLQRRYFDESGYGDRIVQHLGPALDIIPTLQTSFDLVFIDADKENYINYYEMVVPMMNPGGIILSDNVLWSGKVLNEEANDRSTSALIAYNQRLASDPRVETVLLPIRDGLNVTRVI